MARQESAIADLSFQLDAMRRALGEAEAKTAEQKAEQTRGLAQSADEAGIAERRAGELARALVERLRDTPGVAPLLAELEKS